MIKRIIFVVVLLFVFGISTYALDTSASSAVVMVAQTGEIVYSKNAHTRRSMASTTKIMTSLLAVENADLKKQIKVKEDMIKVEGTSMGLLDGDTVSMENLVYGMLLQSGNDAANVAAIMLGGSIEKFSELMNQRAREIGMNNTNFVTPSGLDDENHYSTAYDMALLGCEAIKNVEFRKICSKTTARISYGNPPYMRTLSNHNRLLKSYEGCFGIKTGFTKKSGRCLVTACQRDGITLVCVTLNDPDDWYDHKKMFDYGFENVKNNQLDSLSFTVDVAGGQKNKVNCNLLYTPSIQCVNNIEYSSRVLLDKTQFAPIKKGDILGEVLYFNNGKEMFSVPITATEDVKTAVIEEKPKSFFEKVKEKIKNIFKGDR